MHEMNTLKEDFLLQIREQLRKDGVKLWLPPYMEESTSSQADLEVLSRKYTNELKIPYDFCYQTLLQLQGNSLENLEHKRIFQQSGMATLKIKVLLQNSTRVLTKKILLSISALDLKCMIQEETNISVERVKLISSGRVLKDADSLVSQGVSNGHQVLAIILTESPTQLTEHENQIKELENIRTDSKLLALDNQYMQLEDQFGNSIKIPPDERKALIVAMALHEKGRTSLRRNEYSRALLFFLETDQEFRNCNSELLKTVDNYALLDLDIAWCYLCLGSFAHLPEAHIRLKRCEDKFLSTYGPNLERLIAVKGTPGNEEALFMRLHLLQAIVFYHQNKRAEALQLLRKVEMEIQNLKVDEESLITLVELGYSTTEATIGLRATKGDVNQAANYINEYREKRSESRKRAEIETILEKKKEKLGLCEDGKQYVDPNFVKILVNMGYNEKVATVALKKTNNIISDSIQYIQENPSTSCSSSRSEELLPMIKELAEQLEDAGFDLRMAKLALEKHSGDIMKAANELISNDGIVDGDLSNIVGFESIENIKKKRLEHQEKSDAYKRLKDDITSTDDDYLDINLEQEETFLRQYLSLLEK